MTTKKNTASKKKEPKQFKNFQEFWKQVKKEIRITSSPAFDLFIGPILTLGICSFVFIFPSFIVSLLLGVSNLFDFLLIHIIILGVILTGLMLISFIKNYPNKKGDWISGLVLAGYALIGAVELLVIYFIFQIIELALPIIVTTLILTEILFWLDKQKPATKQSCFWFTVKIKLEKGFQALLGILAITSFAIGTQKILDSINPDFEGIAQTINQALPAIGLALIAVLVFVIFIWINSLKYSKKQGDK